MLNGTFYLNNSGSRWVSFINGKKDKVYVCINGEVLARTAQYFESFGNFASVCVYYKGKRRSILEYTFTPEQIIPSLHNNVI